MSFSPDAIANRFLDLAWEQHGETGHDVSPMKVQKLVFYAHGWFLALTDEPLINEAVQAWKWGPVIQSLYREFKTFGNAPIDEWAKELSVSHDENGKLNLSMCVPTIEIESESRPTDDESAAQAMAIVDRVWNIYGHFTPAQLSNMTHAKGEPWRIIRDKFHGDIPRGISIPNQLIQERFKARLPKG